MQTNKKHLVLIKKYLKWIILFLIIVNYKEIPIYHDLLVNSTIKVYCEEKDTIISEKYHEKHIPCNNFLDCTKKSITKYCKPDAWSMGTKCDYSCSVRAVCVDGFCRTNSYMGSAFFLW